MRRLLLAVSALLIAGAPASAALPRIVSQGPATQMDAQAFVLHSERTGRDYLIEVTPPPVATALPGQTFPAVISLDGGYGITGPMGRMLVSLAGMEASFMVAVGYPSGAPNARGVDLTHKTFEQDGRSQGGGGAKFEAFLLEELGPFLEARFPVAMKKSVLFGHSLGGLFTANLLADHPDAFAAYIIASPSVQRDDGVVARVAAAAARGGGRKVLVAVGGKEPDYMLSGARRIAEALKAPGSTFKTNHRVWADDVHLSYYPAVVMAGFPQMLPRSQPIPDQTGAIRLDPATYGRYVGTYRLADGRTVSVKADGEKLIGQLTGLPPVELVAQSPLKFFIRGVDAKVAFEDAATGPFNAAVLTLNGADARGVRVD